MLVKLTVVDDTVVVVDDSVVVVLEILDVVELIVIELTVLVVLMVVDVCVTIVVVSVAVVEDRWLILRLMSLITIHGRIIHFVHLDWAQLLTTPRTLGSL